jgi:hypothetical protein
MSQRCSICRHPQRDSVDVSVLRDGIRSTARQFQISRSALDRHKRHLSQSIAAHEAREVAVSSDSETPLFPQLEVWIRHCNGALSQAQADKNFRGIIQAIKEQRAYLELKYKLQTEERRQRGLHKDRAQQGSGASDGLQRPPEDIYASIQAITCDCAYVRTEGSWGSKRYSVSPPIWNIFGDKPKCSERDSSNGNCLNNPWAWQESDAR